jgi:hypothetical protein
MLLMLVPKGIAWNVFQFSHVLDTLPFYVSADHYLL